ncbi:transposase [Pelagicoccus mobilis]|uniref:Transposase n=1 Tax=Pelagicoccus mobilis TaxID=415221 RepID=A0A934S0U6_9BACT|nr:transposase [Pelagicoccus mobilis]MBK1878924.1 transposase [Pelagicoccus mobilis]
MPRGPRIETNDGIFHVINRGNYRSYVFEDEGAKASFEVCLLEACDRFGWRLHAYCVMGNHFHLCIATPRGNLSEGMRWLQGTFAARFNRFRKETGHLFQGRFKSLVVEPGMHLCDLVDYIHLNPVRAGVVAPGVAKSYRWSSLNWFSKLKTRPSCLDASWMCNREGLKDSSAGWRSYATSLQMRMCDDPKELEKLEARMCRGWCIGGNEFKKAHMDEFLAKKDTVRLGKEALLELNELHWREALRKCLKQLGFREEDAASASKSVDWKLAIASKLKESTSVKNAWLSERLSMGSPKGMSSNLTIYRRRRSKCPLFGKLIDLNFEH